MEVPTVSLGINSWYTITCQPRFLVPILPSLPPGDTYHPQGTVLQRDGLPVGSRSVQGQGISLRSIGECCVAARNLLPLLPSTTTHLLVPYSIPVYPGTPGGNLPSIVVLYGWSLLPTVYSLGSSTTVLSLLVIPLLFLLQGQGQYRQVYGCISSFPEAIHPYTTLYYPYTDGVWIGYTMGKGKQPPYIPYLYQCLLGMYLLLLDT